MYDMHHRKHWKLLCPPLEGGLSLPEEEPPRKNQRMSEKKKRN